MATLSATKGGWASLADFAAWARHAPPGTLVPAEVVAEVLALAPQAPPAAPPPPPGPILHATTWRERLWTAAADTRIGRRELLEALGRPKSWLYRATSTKLDRAQRIPHRKFGGELEFVVGEIREWVRANEELVVVGPTDGVPHPPKLKATR